MHEQALFSKPVFSLPFDYVPPGRHTVIQLEERREAQTQYCQAILSMLISCEPDTEGGYTLNWVSASGETVRKPVDDGTEKPKWVTMVRDKEVPRNLPPMAVLIAQSDQAPDLFGATREELPAILVFTWGEWAAFRGGAEDGEFDFHLTEGPENQSGESNKA